MQLPTQFKRKLKIFVIANQKGGCGKSTLCLHMASAVAARDHFVGLMDLDPHANLTQWHGLRESGDPQLLQITIDELEAAIPQLEAGGLEYLFIDTPGFEHNDLSKAFSVADLIIIPSKSGPFDLWGTAKSMVDLAKFDVPKVFVLNEVNPSTNISQDAVVALSQIGRLGPIIHWKADFMGCLYDGSTIEEVNPRNFGCTEIAALTDFVLISAGVHVENPVVIDPTTRKVAKPKKASKHAAIDLKKGAPKKATAPVLKQVK